MEQNSDQPSSPIPEVYAPTPGQGPTLRRHVQALADRLAADDVSVETLFEVMLENHGVEAAAVFSLAGIACGRPPQARQVARLLPLIKDQADMFPVLAWHAAGDRLAMLLDLAESDSMYYSRSVQCLFLAMELLEGQEPPRLLCLLRYYGRLIAPDALLGQLIGRVRDPAARKVGAAHIRKATRCPVWTKNEVARLRRRLEAAPLEFLPAEPVRRVSGFTVYRTSERVGRNDPCPCGSGKKYKKCCQQSDQEHPQDPSPVPGLTMPQYRARIHEFLTPQQFGDLQIDEMLESPLDKLPLLYQAEAMRLCLALGQWELGERIMGYMDASDAEREAVEEQRVELLHKALIGRKAETVVRQYPLLRNPELLNPWLLSGIHLMVLSEHSVPILNGMIAQCLADPGDQALLSVATTVLDIFPALGIMLARGVLIEESARSPDLLLSAVEQARDRLNLPPGDPCQQVSESMRDRYQVERLRHESEEHVGREWERLRQKEAELEQRLRQATAREEVRDRRLREADEALAAARAAVAGQVEEAEHQRLLRRLEHLKELIAEGHRERAMLRQALAAARAALVAPPDVSTTAGAVPVTVIADRPEPGEDDGEELPGEPEEGRRQVLVPVLSRAARAALLEVPAQVTREALLTMARLGGGDPAMWGEAKRLKATSLWSVRVARCYRLLFRPEDRRLEVVDLRHRRNLVLGGRRISRAAGATGPLG